MLGDSAVLSGGGGGSGDAAAAAAAAGGGGAERTATSGGAVGSNSGDDERGRIEEGERSFGGNRWPRQETLALLRIRSDMDVAFRDAAVKGPLWEEVSRKLAELGYHRNAKKCKEKFENVYKYHKRTKEGRSGKSDGKTYRFFDQLQALENHPSLQSPNSSNSRPVPPPPQPQPQAPPALVVTTAATTVPMPLTHVSTVPSTTTTPPNMPMPQGIAISTTPSMNLTNTIPSFPTSNPTNFPPSTANPSNTTTPISFPTIPMDLMSNSTSSSTSSDETLEGRRKRKRKWKDFFERLMKEVVEKQEDLQKKFLEAIEKREHDRTAREEAWRVQEMQRINREREILAQERSIAAAKDAAVMSFLQKIAEQQNLGQALSNIVPPPPRPPQPVTQPSAAPPPAPTPAQGQAQIVQQQQPVAPITQPGPPPTQSVMAGQVGLVPQQGVTGMEIVKADNGENFMGASSSRWPKVEVEALIKLRTSLDSKYQENGPKGPLWEEISALMRNLGYNRNAKRCKEKWENINKYFKKVKESNKKRPEDSKTCPYFHQLDALYREKKSQVVVRPPESSAAPLMVQPEQQWPPQQKITRDVTMEDAENDPMDQHHEDDEDDVEDEDEEGESGGSGSGGGGNYEIVASKPAAAAAE